MPYALPDGYSLTVGAGGQPSVAPQSPSEVETEWELLSDDSVGSIQPLDIDVKDHQAVVRRFEYYKYKGGYDEVHLPTSVFSGGGTPPDPSELGDFMMANMVAANLQQEIVPEPSTFALLGTATLGLLGFALRRRTPVSPPTTHRPNRSGPPIAVARSRFFALFLHTEAPVNGFGGRKLTLC